MGGWGWWVGGVGGWVHVQGRWVGWVGEAGRWVGGRVDGWMDASMVTHHIPYQRAPRAWSVQACLAQRKLEAVVRLATLTPLADTGERGAAGRGAAGRGAAGRGAAGRAVVLLRAAGAGRLCSRDAFSPFVFSWLHEACRQVRRWLKTLTPTLTLTLTLTRCAAGSRARCRWRTLT